MLRLRLLPSALLLTLLLAPRAVSAVETPFTSQVGLELGGEGLALSLQYENLVLSVHDRHRLLARAGIGYLPLFINGEMAFGNAIIPLGAHYLYGFGAHHLELGLATPVRIMVGDIGESDARTVSLSFVPSVGYRYQDFHGGRFFLGVAYSPRITRGVFGLTYANYVRLSTGVRF